VELTHFILKTIDLLLEREETKFMSINLTQKMVLKSLTMSLLKATTLHQKPGQMKSGD